MPSGPAFACIDEIELGSLDFIDFGKPPPGEGCLPVVVTSLAFAPPRPVSA